MQGHILDFVIGAALQIAGLAAELHGAGRDVFQGWVFDRGIIASICRDLFVTVRIVKFAWSFLTRHRTTR